MSNTSGNKPNDSDPNGNSGLKKKLRSTAEKFEQALNGSTKRSAAYILRLYVTGSTPRSLKAIHNLKRICQEHLSGDYDLEVIDIYKNPDAARDAQIIAAPTLIKRLPEPLRRFVGDLSNKEKILIGLDISK
jgi:circadian clock protein KaiB